MYKIYFYIIDIISDFISFCYCAFMEDCTYVYTQLDNSNKITVCNYPDSLDKILILKDKVLQFIR